MQKYFKLTVPSGSPSVGWTLDGETMVIEGVWLSYRSRMSVDTTKRAPTYQCMTGERGFYAKGYSRSL